MPVFESKDKMIAAIDPGKKAGYALWSVVECYFPNNGYDLDPYPTYLEDETFDVLLVEAQYPNPDASRQSLITLGFNAGYRAGFFMGISGSCESTKVAKPGEWRSAFGRGYRSVSKEQLHARLWRDFPYDLPIWDDVESHDVRDACAMILSYRINPKVWKKVNIV